MLYSGSILNQTRLSIDVDCQSIYCLHIVVELFRIYICAGVMLHA